ncbi:MAG: META domain-containing protein [Ignavibacteriae bacterium]|nr:META domain-containing protein [Ignavibacteriota bacterium]MCB9242811.1 META domain-containing protein [Ignavibacteriales bacterium]
MRTILLIFFIVSIAACNTVKYSAENIWRLYELNGDSILPGKSWDEEIVFMFEKNNRIEGFGGCNELTGSYEKGIYDIKFKVISTKRYCEGKMEIENEFINALNSANRYDLPYENELYLYKDSLLLAKFMGTIVK